MALCRSPNFCVVTSLYPIRLSAEKAIQISIGPSVDKWNACRTRNASSGEMNGGSQRDCLCSFKPYLLTEMPSVVTGFCFVCQSPVDVEMISQAGQFTGSAATNTEKENAVKTKRVFTCAQSIRGVTDGKKGLIMLPIEIPRFCTLLRQHCIASTMH